MKEMKRFCYILSLLLAVLAAGCGSGKNETGRILVSIPPQKYIVRQLLGEDTEVRTILTSSANPEMFEPGMNTVLSLMNSDVYFTVGTLDFEKKLVGDAQRKGKVNVIDTSEGVRLLYGSHDDCGHHHHGDGAEHHHHSSVPDPHIWSTPANMKTMAGNMASGLIQLYPDKKETIEANLSSFNARMDGYDARLRETLAGSGAKTFMVWHPSLSYLADVYGLEQITVGAGNKEASAGQLAERIKKAHSEKASILFLQKEFDPEQAKVIADGSEVKVVVINPMNEDWNAEMELIINAFSDVK